MKAHEAFRETIKRARAFAELHEELCPVGKPRHEYADILRAAVVFAVSAMDAYLHDKILEKVTPLVIARKGKQLPGKLVEIIKDEATHERLLEIIFEERPPAHLATLVRKHISDLTFQNAGKIEGALKVLGLDDVWYQVGTRLGVGKEKARGFVQAYVDRRHAIVHEGDLGKAKKIRHRLAKITRPYAKKCVSDVERFIGAIDYLIEAKIP